MNQSNDNKNRKLNVEQTQTGSAEQRSRIDDYHHSSSHRHHSRAYYRYRRIRHKIKKYFKKKKYRKYVFIILIAAIVFGVIYASTRNNSPEKVENNAKTDTQVEENVENSLSFVDIKFPYFSKEAVLSCPYVSNYMSSGKIKTLNEYLNKYTAADRYDKGIPIEFEYEVQNLPVDTQIKSSKLTVWEKDDASAKTVLPFDAQKAQLYNLKTNTVYCYTIEIILNDGTSNVSSGTFKTTQTPRFINADGAVNVRDIGGWQTEGNKYIKQGMVYRGSEIDGRYSKTFSLSESGIKTMRSTLGIKSDFDLRNKDEGIPKYSPLGKDVKHNIYGAYEYNLSNTSSVKNTYKNIFSGLADKNNYPVYIHCTHGLDRTGTVCFMLEALLGVPEESLVREYELSELYFTNINARDKNSDFNKFLNNFKALEGSTMQEKAENYLLSCGVTKDEINSIKNLLTEEN